MLDKITVSVIVITYNQEKFIQQCLTSILAQKCNFEIEIIVANDNSPDETDNIIQSIIDNNKNSKWIRYYKHAQNKGMKQNFIWTLNQSKGKYIAICEGDDYWTDPLKLQKQVAFLDVNSEYVGCYHGCKHVDENDFTIMASRYKNYHDQPSEKMLTAQGAMITHTVMFRNIIKGFPPIFEKAPSGDTILYHLLGFHGAGKFLPDIEYSAYRIHSGGIWSSIDDLQRMKNTLSTLSAIKLNLIQHFGENPKYVSEITGSVSMNINGYLFQSLISKNFTEYLQMIRLILTQENFSKSLLLKKHVVYILKKFLKIKS